MEKLIEYYGYPDSEVAYYLSNKGIQVDEKAALSYLKKYFLPEEEYLQFWRPIQNSIFQNEERGLPAKIFKDEFSLMAIRGGILFERKDFESLQRCVREIGDKNLIIIQNDFGGIVKKPLFRMKYSADVTWNELLSRNFISTLLVEMSYNEYFVFSESGLWGKYAANDYDYPLDIIGFKSEFASLFSEQFKQPKEEQEEIQEWLPAAYKSRLNVSIPDNQY